MRQLKILGVTILLCVTFQLQAQDYSTGIGLRAGWEGGLTVKHFISPDAALEGIVSSGYGRYGGIRFTALYEIHKQAFGTSGLNWYYGPGAHIGFYNAGYHKDWSSSNMVIGIDGILGIEYKINEIPFTVGLDVKPFIDIIGWGAHFFDGAFVIRYYIE